MTWEKSICEWYLPDNGKVEVEGSHTISRVGEITWAISARESNFSWPGLFFDLCWILVFTFSLFVLMCISVAFLFDWVSGLRHWTQVQWLWVRNHARTSVLRWLLNANFHRLSRSHCYFVVLRCRWFRTNAASACPLLETIDRVYLWRFTG